MRETSSPSIPRLSHVQMVQRATLPFTVTLLVAIGCTSDARDTPPEQPTDSELSEVNADELADTSDTDDTSFPADALHPDVADGSAGADASTPGDGLAPDDSGAPRDANDAAPDTDLGDSGPEDSDASSNDAMPPGCTTSIHCDDMNACTLDDCVDGECTHAEIPCEDGDLCTLDGCAPEIGCAFLTMTCPSTDPCSPTACHAFTGTCEPVDAPCDDDNSCTTDSCSPLTGCTHQLLTAAPCCSMAEDCGVSPPCAAWICALGECVLSPLAGAECCNPLVYEETFDDGVANGFSLDPPPPGDATGWTIAPPGSLAPSFSLYFGDLATQSYAGGPWSGAATTPTIALPPGVQLALVLRIMADVEPALDFDVLAVTAESSTGAHTILGKALIMAHPLGLWADVSVDLSPLAGQAVRLHFTFDTIDDAFNEGKGVIVDWLRITSTCAPPMCEGMTPCGSAIAAWVGECDAGECFFVPNPHSCATDSDCTPTEPCRETTCVDGYCLSTPLSGCCVTPAECDDGVLCTTDLCVIPPTETQGTCAHAQSPLCCSKAADCSNKDPCLVGSCPGELHICSFVETAACCIDDLDCGPAEPCSKNVCQAGECVALPTCCETDMDCTNVSACLAGSCGGGACSFTAISPECCTAVLLSAEFDDWSEMAQWKGLDPTGATSWYLANDISFQGSGSMGYGAATTGTYGAAPPTGGEARTPPFLLPSAGATLSFRLWLDTEWTAGSSANLGVDVLEVELEPTEGEPILLWSSASPSLPWWDLTSAGWLAGPKWSRIGPLDVQSEGEGMARIVFRFLPYDGLDNDHAGPRIDGLRLVSPCPPPLD